VYPSIAGLPAINAETSATAASANDIAARDKQRRPTTPPQ
jgi:hypothetical protein